MRISDWSSDVCSSDLAERDVLDRGVQARAGDRVGGAVAFIAGSVDRERRKLDDVFFTLPGGGTGTNFLGLGRRNDDAEGRGRAQNRRDRKSVVWGKRVSVRVNIGGRRSIKKKK